MDKNLPENGANAAGKGIISRFLNLMRKPFFFSSFFSFLPSLPIFVFCSSLFKLHLCHSCQIEVTSQEIDGKTVETVSDFILGGSKITADGDCSREIKRCLLLGRKVMTNLDSILISRDITLPTKVHLVKAVVFPVVMYGCESWTVRKAECRRIDAFELWCQKRLLRVAWIARRSNQSILKEISPECSLEGLMLKLKLHYFGHLMWRVTRWKRPWCWEGLGAGGEGDNREWDGWMESPTQWTWVWVNSGSWWWTGRPGMLWFMGSQRVGRDWTELNWIHVFPGELPISLVC